jgi:hypothetical protein
LGGANLLAFVKNNPVNKWDKLGLQWDTGEVDQVTQMEAFVVDEDPWTAEDEAWYQMTQNYYDPYADWGMEGSDSGAGGGGGGDAPVDEVAPTEPVVDPNAERCAELRTRIGIAQTSLASLQRNATYGSNLAQPQTTTTTPLQATTTMLENMDSVGDGYDAATLIPLVRQFAESGTAPAELLDKTFVVVGALSAGANIGEGLTEISAGNVGEGGVQVAYGTASGGIVIGTLMEAGGITTIRFASAVNPVIGAAALGIEAAKVGYTLYTNNKDSTALLNTNSDITARLESATATYAGLQTEFGDLGCQP